MKNAAVIYWSSTGNTKKVAMSIKEGLEEAGLDVKVFDINDSGEIEYFDYDLVCIGFPSHSWKVPPKMAKILEHNFKKHKKAGRVKLGCPRVGKYVLIFCTYSGPHTGIAEAIPAGKMAGQYFDHVGFDILDEIYVLCEFIGKEEHSTKGRMGDIRGLPTSDDLEKIKQKTIALVNEVMQE